MDGPLWMVVLAFIVAGLLLDWNMNELLRTVVNKAMYFYYWIELYFSTRIKLLFQYMLHLIQSINYKEEHQPAPLNSWKLQTCLKNG